MTHIVGGFVTLVLAFAQIGLGFSEWKGRPGREATNIIYAMYVVQFFLYTLFIFNLLMFLTSCEQLRGGVPFDLRHCSHFLGSIS